MQALARLLREDSRKSDAGQLCVSLLAAFLALSRVPAAHVLLQQVGLWRLCLQWREPADAVGSPVMLSNHLTQIASASKLH